jgi:hypothetical protein
MEIKSTNIWIFKDNSFWASYRLDTDRRLRKYFDLLPNFTPGKITLGIGQNVKAFQLNRWGGVSGRSGDVLPCWLGGGAREAS